MTQKLYINEKVLDQARAEDVALVKKTLSDLKIINEDIVFKASSDVPNPCEEGFVCSPPRLIAFGFPGNIIDAVGDVLTDAAKPACEAVCDAVLATAAAACIAQTVGAAQVLCLAVAEEVRKECRKKC